MYNPCCIFLITLALSTNVISKQQDGILHFDDVICKGKYGGNYTIDAKLVTNSACSLDGIKVSWVTFMSKGPNKRHVYLLNALARSKYDDGANMIWDNLALMPGSGPLSGKYIFNRIIWPKDVYLKKCSSALGHSYVPSRSFTQFILDKVDLSELISPGGAYSGLEKSASSKCKGRGYIV